jgi:hypothetical protein
VSPGVEIAEYNVLAGLAHARYAPECDPGENTCNVEALTVLTSLNEARTAVNQVAGRAQRLLSIYTPNLEPELYDQSEFLEVIKRLVLARPFAKVRMLIGEPGRSSADGHRFLAMARRLSSCMDVRNLPARNGAPHCAYLIADERAIMYRLRADCWDGIADLDNAPVARLYLHEFEQLWDTCTPPESLRLARPA